MAKSNGKIQMEVAHAIIAGDLFVEEAMLKYNIKSKRTVAAWVKKAMSVSTDSGKAQELLQKKILELEDKIRRLEEQNLESAQYQTFLARKLTMLELKIKEKVVF